MDRGVRKRLIHWANVVTLWFVVVTLGHLLAWMAGTSLPDAPAIRGFIFWGACGLTAGAWTSYWEGRDGGRS